MDHEPNEREADEGQDKKQSFKDNLIGGVFILPLFGILLPACSGSCGKSSSSDRDSMSDHEKKVAEQAHDLKEWRDDYAAGL